MLSGITIKVPDLDDSGLTSEARDVITLYLSEVKNQYNESIAEIEARLQALE